MSFLLEIDATRWRAHVADVRSTVESVEATTLVPVVKGGGYGLGQQLLAGECTTLGVSCVAVGTVAEVPEVAVTFGGDVLVLEPYEPRDAVATADWDALCASDLAHRLVRTLASLDGVRAAVTASTAADTRGPVRAVVEGLTSVRRFGFEEHLMVAALGEPATRAALADGSLRLEGLALHLPMAPGTPSRVEQVVAWGHRWAELVRSLPDAAVTERAATLWVSHLTDEELRRVREALPGIPLRPRVGTRVWLGDRGALRASGTVLAVHPYDGAVTAGYRQRKGPRDGTLVVVSGGTSHGVALEAPSPAATVRQRAVAAGTGALEAVGRALSPFTWQGKQRWFAEPPHMHVSLVWLPRGCVVPAVGDRLTCEVRFSTAVFDHVELVPAAGGA